MIQSEENENQKSSLIQKVMIWSTIVPIVYLLSSGPVIALSFWLRETLGWDGFYYSMYLYYPLFFLGRDSFFYTYLEWWVVDVFRTVGPG